MLDRTLLRPLWADHFLAFRPKEARFRPAEVLQSGSAAVSTVAEEPLPPRSCENPTIARCHIIHLCRIDHQRQKVTHSSATSLCDALEVPSPLRQVSEMFVLLVQKVLRFPERFRRFRFRQDRKSV